MKAKLITMAVLRTLPMPDPSRETWCMDPAQLRGTHGWPHGDHRFPFLARAPLMAGITQRIVRGR